ncbi:MAG: hypothetical protein OXJ52_06615 [Oligoflexia bacterium]|nr:hypothetical protein [Oligoflexia bacterium]
MIKKLLEQEITLNLNKKPSETEITEKLDQSINIKFKLTQGWRNYAKHGKSFLKKLIQVYYKQDFSGTIPLLTKNDSSKKEKQPKKAEFSIQSLKNELNKERYLAMQSVFKEEKNIVKKNKIEQSNLKGDYKKYLPFDKVLEKLDILDAVKQDFKKIRNACFHNDIWEQKFSEVPEPLKSIYSKLEKQQKEKGNQQKKKGQEKNRFIKKSKKQFNTKK